VTSPLTASPEGDATSDTARPVRKPPRRKPVKRGTIWLHRWASLVIGTLLVIECTTGALLVYHPELDRHLRGDVFGAPRDQAASDQSMAASIDAATAYDPEFEAHGVYDDKGTHVVQNYDNGESITVDPRSGEVLGEFDSLERPDGKIAWVLGLSYNVHLCGLTCEGYPGYAGWALEEVPFTEWAGFPSEEGAGNTPLTWGGLLLGITALLLVFLALSGIWLWWPTIRHFRRGVRIRWGRNRYARDYDLHQVIGMIALPLLLLWAVTGMSYEFGFVEKGYYKAMPGEAQEAELVVDDSQTAEITFDQALAAASETAGATSPPALYEPPAADDPAGSHAFWFSVGYDPWAEGRYPGDVEVLVDRHDATHTAIVYGDPEQPLSQTIYQDFNYPTHSGFFVNGWIRILWLVLGLVPLVLMWTGVSTWLFKRTVHKRRLKAAAARNGA